MNWWYLIPIVCGAVLLFVDPWTLAIMLAGVPMIVGASFVFEKVFGAPKK